MLHTAPLEWLAARALLELPFTIAKGLPEPFAADLLSALLPNTRNRCPVFLHVTYHVECQTARMRYIGIFTGVLGAA